jgi:hypothetical protein
MWHAWERRGKCTELWWESPKDRDHMEDQDVDGRMSSEWILGRLAGECRLDPVGSGQTPVAFSCKYDHKPAGSGATVLVSCVCLKCE